MIELVDLLAYAVVAYCIAVIPHMIYICLVMIMAIKSCQEFRDDFNRRKLTHVFLVAVTAILWPSIYIRRWFKLWA